MPSPVAMACTAATSPWLRARSISNAASASTNTVPASAFRSAVIASSGNIDRFAKVSFCGLPFSSR